MADSKIDMAPANWQVTATTIDCDMVHEYVTIMVHRDWSCKCTWWAKYKKVAGDDPRHRFSKQITGQITKCKGPDCEYVTGYRDRLIKEEKAA
jgi:hypothetical protein